MKKVLQLLGWGIGFFILFLILTFPFSRLGPKIRSWLEQSLTTLVYNPVKCELEGFGLSAPFGFKAEKLRCLVRNDREMINFKNIQLLILPGRQSLKTKLDSGELWVRTNWGLRSTPDRMEATFNKVPVQNVMPLVMALANRLSSMIPSQLDIEGLVTGELNLPLQRLETTDGSMNIEFSSLRLPPQAFLDIAGFKELSFSKAALKAEINAGKLTIKDIAFLSEPLSGKLDGQLDLQSDLSRSSGNLILKWKIQKTDALMKALYGQILANIPCPAPDSEGFCTKRFVRLGDLIGGQGT